MKLELHLFVSKELQEAITDAASGSTPAGATEDEADAHFERECNKADDVCRAWFRGLDRLRLKIDTDDKTISIAPAGER